MSAADLTTNGCGSCVPARMERFGPSVAKKLFLLGGVCSSGASTKKPQYNPQRLA
jgi:hypothetical protein